MKFLKSPNQAFFDQTSTFVKFVRVTIVCAKRSKLGEVMGKKPGAWEPGPGPVWPLIADDFQGLADDFQKLQTTFRISLTIFRISDGFQNFMDDF